MADYQHTETVASSADALFDYLSDVKNLPSYITRLTKAEMVDGGAVRVTAKLDQEQTGQPGEKTVTGEAWLRVNQAERRLEWGSEGPNDYHGELDVTGDGHTSRVVIRLHTERAEGPAVDQGLAETVATLKQIVEQRSPPRRAG